MRRIGPSSGYVGGLVLASLRYVSLRWLLEFVVLRVRSEEFKELEIVVLRQQIFPACQSSFPSLNRLDEPTAGTGLLAGVDYHQIPPRELRRKVGRVTQRALLISGTVYQNAGFGPRQ